VIRHDGLESFPTPPGGVALTIGNFDGVHLGHRRLIETARSEASDLGIPVAAITFEPHPLAILSPDRAPPRLTTLDERLALLGAAGVDAAIVVRTNRDLLAIAADEFLELVVSRCRPRVIVEGPTFNFGRGRAGSVVTLQEHAPRLGYRAVVVEELYGRELGGNPPINSSNIREALREGRVEDAAAMLGRPYRIVGVVGAGAGRGGPMGFPTANLDRIPHMLPRHAVYAAVAQLASGAFHVAAANIGPQPTFDQMTARVEAHLLGFSGDLRNQPLGLHLLAHVRDQQKFLGVAELLTQIRADCDTVQRYAVAVDRLRPGMTLTF
jgi:riboflavin kinase/FMN adenylyltransferase